MEDDLTIPTGSMIQACCAVWKCEYCNDDVFGAHWRTGDILEYDRHFCTLVYGQDKDVLEKIASSVAMAAVLDQKQRWTQAVQLEHLRRVLAESLHQVLHT